MSNDVILFQAILFLFERLPLQFHEKKKENRKSEKSIKSVKNFVKKPRLPTAHLLSTAISREKRVNFFFFFFFFLQNSVQMINGVILV